MSHLQSIVIVTLFQQFKNCVYPLTQQLNFRILSCRYIGIQVHVISVHLRALIIYVLIYIPIPILQIMETEFQSS